MIGLLISEITDSWHLIFQALVIRLLGFSWLQLPPCQATLLLDFLLELLLATAVLYSKLVFSRWALCHCHSVSRVCFPLSFWAAVGSYRRVSPFLAVFSLYDSISLVLYCSCALTQCLPFMLVTGSWAAAWFLFIRHFCNLCGMMLSGVYAGVIPYFIFLTVNRQSTITTTTNTSTTTTTKTTTTTTTKATTRTRTKTRITPRTMRIATTHARTETWTTTKTIILARDLKQCCGVFMLGNSWRQVRGRISASESLSATSARCLCQHLGISSFKQGPLMQDHCMGISWAGCLRQGFCARSP